MAGRRLLVTAAVALLAVAATAVAAPRNEITPAGVDGVKLGTTYQELVERFLVGKLRRGCELAGPNARSARLRSPLRGTVNFTRTTPLRVTDITASRGSTNRGVGIGATIPKIKAAYPKAKVDHSTDSTFGITLVKIPKNGGGKLQFAVDTDTRKVTLIGIPFIAFCE